jgi:hypothetical protein
MPVEYERRAASFEHLSGFRQDDAAGSKFIRGRSALEGWVQRKMRIGPEAPCSVF